VKNLKFYLYYFPETLWFSDIHTDLFYPYCFPLSFDMLILDVLTFIMLSLVTCLISPSCHVITWHPACYT